MMFKAEMTAPRGPDCNICFQALIAHNAYPGCNGPDKKHNGSELQDRGSRQDP